MHADNQQVILTIDDERVIRESFCNYLEDYDYEVCEAENGRVGIDVIKDRTPDLVLCDLRMPEVDGLAVLKWVQENASDMPIVVVSGTGAIGDAIEALRLGAWDYLLKPVENLDVLLHTVEKSLERARLIRENREYEQHLEEMVKTRTAQLSAANRELEETRMQIIQRLGKAAEYKDNETGRHVIRVSYYSRIIAEAIGMEPDRVDLVHQCSPMHDIGKIGIPDRILLKAGPLDTEEWDFMRKHCSMGAEMLQPVSPEEVEIYRNHTSIGGDIVGGSDSSLLQTARKIAACHHEHWDGSGYPNGLKGEEIPIEARIVSVADIYDALCSKRSYKEPFSEEKSREILKEQAGRFLDPNLVDVFFDNMDKIIEVRERWKD